jgi:hypothetical protein
VNWIEWFRIQSKAGFYDAGDESLGLITTDYFFTRKITVHC